MALCSRLVRSVARIGVASALLSAIAIAPAGARVVDRQRYSFTSEGHERTCGRHLTVDTTMSGIQMTKSRSGGHYTLYDNYNIHEVLTDAAGEGYIIDQNGLYTEIRV